MHCSAQRALEFISGDALLSQVSLPVARVSGMPMGLGLIGPHGSDEALLVLTENIMAAKTAHDAS